MTAQAARLVSLWLVLLLLCSHPVLSSGRGEPGPYFAVGVQLADEAGDLERLRTLDMDVDAVFDGWARVYVVSEELDKLRLLGYDVRVLPTEEVDGPGVAPDEAASGVDSVPAEYHTYASLSAELQAIAAAHPEIARLSSLGQSVQGLELWVMQITDNPDVEEDEPEVAYISSMHGDEVVGKELCFNLIDYLTQNYGTDPRVTDLVDNTEIWILPSMNPDGTELGQRYNANGFDLNRDFPDQFIDPVNTPDGRQAETKAVMSWTANRSLNLAANMHGGALVVNYPFDSNPAGTSTFSPTPLPDHPAFVSISRTYADNNPPMSVSNAHPAFDNGITNGADWYAVNGGMQDWAYVWYGTFHVLLELGESKWPPASQLPSYWSDNLESMLAYLERVHEGLRGTVTDAETALPLAATIRLEGNPIASHSDPDVGDYHRPVLPGTYSLEVSAPGYLSQIIPVTVGSGAAARLDFALQPLPTDLQPTAYRLIDGPGGNGWGDPGESADLAVRLVNLGRSASAVSARLEPTGWYAEVSRATASYPDLANNDSAESNEPHYAIALDAGVPPGHKVGFALRWQAAQAAGLSEPFFVEVGAPTCETVQAADVPQSILDLATTSSQVDVTANQQLSELQVAVNVAHTFTGDLTLTLASPSGTTVLLHDRAGGSADDIVGTYGIDLDPAESLAAFNGETTAGTWQLEVADLAAGDTGTLNDWSLTLCGRPVESTTPEMRLRELVAESEAVRLHWWPYPGLDSYRVYRATDPSDVGAFIDVTASDDDDTDTQFLDHGSDPLVFYIVTGVGPQGEGPKGHFGQ